MVRPGRAFAVIENGYTLDAPMVCANNNVVVSKTTWDDATDSDSECAIDYYTNSSDSVVSNGDQ